MYTINIYVIWKFLFYFCFRVLETILAALSCVICMYNIVCMSVWYLYVFIHCLLFVSVLFKCVYVLVYFEVNLSIDDFEMTGNGTSPHSSPLKVNTRFSIMQEYNVLRAKINKNSHILNEATFCDHFVSVHKKINIKKLIIW